jgi:hypothetical protein
MNAAERAEYAFLMVRGYLNEKAGQSFSDRVLSNELGISEFEAASASKQLVALDEAERYVRHYDELDGFTTTIVFTKLKQ